MLLPQVFQTISSSLYLTLFVVVSIGIIVFYYVYMFAEQTYAEKFKKPFFINCVLVHKKLSNDQLSILRRQFSFYNKLNIKQQSVFEHRVATFIKEKNFFGRQGVIVNDEMKVLISATAVMLTFGFRNYKLPIISSVLIYPESFISPINNNLHKGEVNPKLGLIALSWKDFLEGYDIANDNLNLGIHEFGHTIHLNSHVKSDISSQIFIDNFKRLKAYLRQNDEERKNLISTKYFRAYAYTNEFEFVAVLIECFFETPTEFKRSFPKLYLYLRDMLNFHYADF